MSTRKVLLTILLEASLAALCLVIFNSPYKQADSKSKVDFPKHLNWWNEGYNSGYFDDKLPKHIVIDWSEYNDDNMATTTVLPDGRFHIALNEKYCLATRVAHITLLHEDCHILTFSEVNEGKEHGPRWRTCMINLSRQRAFENELIDDK